MNFNPQQNKIAGILFKAEYCSSASEKLTLYQSAVKRCKEYGLRQSEAEIHCKIANLNLLTMSDPSVSLQNAEDAIIANPTFSQGYYCRAKALCSFVMSSIKYGDKEKACDYYIKVIDAYFKAYSLSNNCSHICEAIIIGVEQEMTDLLCLEKKLDSNECAKLIKFIADSALPWKCRLIQYLVVKSGMPGSGLASTLSCDLHSFPWNNLLQTHGLNEAIVRAITALKGTITNGDIYTLIRCAEKEDTVNLELSIDHCMPKLSNDSDLIKLYEFARKWQKFQFTAKIMSCLLSTQDPNRLILEAIKLGSFDIVEKVLVSQEENVNPAIVVKNLSWGNISSNSSLVSCLKSTPQGLLHLFYKAVENIHLKPAEDCFLTMNLVTKNMIDLSYILKVLIRQVNQFWKRKFVSFIGKLLQLGIDANGRGGACPLDIVLKLSNDYSSEKLELISLLLQHGAVIDNCVHEDFQDKTLIHIATEFVLKSGEAIRFFEQICKHYPFEIHPNGQIQDSNGSTPYHLVMACRKSPNTIRICEILSQYRINPNLANKSGKKALDKKGQDKRNLIMQEAAKQFQTPKKRSGKRKRNRLHSAPASCSNSTTDDSNAAFETDSSHKQQVEEMFDIALVIQDVHKMLTELSGQPQSYFEPPPNYVKEKSKPHNVQEKAVFNNEGTNCTPSLMEQTPAAVKSKQDIKIVPDCISKSTNLEDSPWEVECTDRVKKFFTDSKVPRIEKERVVETIKKLVDGIPTNNPNLYKEVRSSIKLFEAHYSKGSRILYEIAIQFSPRLTSSDCYIYTEVIRVWDIVRDHDKLNRSIDHVQCIKKSQSRGKQAAIQVPLKVNTNQLSKQSTQGQEKLRLPQCYAKGTSKNTLDSETPVFTPAGSTKEDEYNVITFYSFDSSFVRSMLEGENVRRDFPFKEWPKEHDIISMPQGEVSILLLGRSGTGKTTCCLYRLWNQFQAYWSKVALANNEPCFSHRPLAILESISPEVCNGESLVNEDPVANHSDTDDTASANPDAIHASQEQPFLMQHFHQVFITKNYVLCAQMKKRFYDLAAGSDIAEQHTAYEDSTIPSSFSEVDDHAYPLFLTARQFFILLDNSLHDGKTFFPRDSEGKLAERIVSSDYDHEDPDTLLDLEESESEREGSDYDDDDIKISQPATEMRSLPQHREITSSYFTEKIWPKISKNVSLRDTKIDPLLVWMEIKSFIKGSMKAIRKEEGYLSQDEYEALGKKMAPNYVDNRSDIYKIFKLYLNYVKHHSDESIFDECDLNHNIFTRLNALKDLRWSIHSIFIDEVQDFTQAELSILIRICREPNGLFLTGDTAQSIMRGISFRFGDLKSIFYHASEQASKSVKSAQVKVPKVNELTINFRSHTGVLRLAASVIDLMKHFFPSSFDCLPGDEGMFPGPTPILLDSCNVSDLALVLRTNKRESSTIEFGAHQVIIVQSEEAKNSIPDVLKAGIVLTVFEAKGLEFDDVLIYNFFNDSKIDKDWRVITSLIEENDIHKNKSAFSDVPRRLEFDESQHKSLNAELKYLYTAITRAKCNLWIYDSNKDRRLPMFHYWDRKDLVQVIRVDESTDEDQSTLFSATSSAEEWKSQGDYFKKKRLWEPAMKCYQKANCLHLECEARAYSLAQQARTPGLKRDEVNEIYLEAAHAFLKCDQSEHDYRCLENAAKCLKNAKKYKESSQLYLLLNQNEMALKGYKRAKDVEGIASIKDKMGDYDGAIRLLLKHNRITDALKYAAKHESRISKCYNVHYMATECVEKLLNPAVHTLHNKRADFEQFEAAMEHLAPTKRVHFYKAANMHEKACEVLKALGKYEDLTRVFKAQGWHNEGIELAKSRKDPEEAVFILFKATAEIASNNGDLEENTREMLKEKLKVDTEIGAKTCLIYGNATDNHTIIKAAQRYFKKEHNSIGLIEAFNIAVSRVEYNSANKTWNNIDLDKYEDFLDSALTICREIRFISASLSSTEKSSSVQKQIAGQIERFYGFEKKNVEEGELHELYVIPQSSYPWTNQLLKQLKVDTRMTDADGMLQLEIKNVFKEICNRMEGYIRNWIVADRLKLVEDFIESFSSHPLNQEIAKGGYLQSFVSGQSRQGYFKLVCSAFDLAHYGNLQVGEKGNLFQAILDAISPQATCYLSEASVSLKIHSNFLTQRMTEMVNRILRTNDQAFNFDEWIEAWRIVCVSRRGLERMKSNLVARSDQFTKKHQFHEHSIPPVYVLDGPKKTYQHLMLLWLHTCELFRARDTLTACTIAVYQIVHHIASEQSLWSTVSISNLLNLLTIHTTAILAMNAACSIQCQREESVIYLPHSYRNVTGVFSSIINVPPNTDFYKACINSIMHTKNFPVVLIKLKKMLSFILEVMIGLLISDFNPLKLALGKEECLKNGEARHCLVFVLNLFCNISVIEFEPTVLQKYRHYIHVGVKHCGDPVLAKYYCQFLNSRTLLGCFGVTRELIETSKDSLLQTRFFINRRYGTTEMKFSPAKFNSLSFNKLQFLPFPAPITPQQHSKPVRIQSSLRAEAEPFIPKNGSFGSVHEFSKVTSTDPIVPAHSGEPPKLQQGDNSEVSAALANQSTAPDNPIPNEDSLVDYSFCTICAHEVVNLSGSVMSTDQMETLYNEHCHSEGHLQNVELKQQFDSEETDYFVCAKKELLGLLPRCHLLQNFSEDGKIQDVMAEIESEIKTMEKYLLKIRDSGEWNEGIHHLRNEYPGIIQGLQIKSKRLIEEAEKNKREIESGAKQQEKKDEDELIEDEKPEEDEDILQTCVNYGQKDKEKSRKLKKLRRDRK